MATAMPSLTLNEGHTIPQLGFGGDQIPDQQTEAAVTIALEAGYRHIDTATAYLNEAETGAAIAASSLPRDELFVTTKVSNNDQGRDRTRRAFESSLAKLGLDHLDLYLIHWPAPSRGLYEETWLTLIDLQREGLVRSIGVANFEPEHLDRLAETSDVVPAVNQIEVQPFLQQERLRAYHHEHGIVTASWSHLAEAVPVRDQPRGQFSTSACTCASAIDSNLLRAEAGSHLCVVRRGAGVGLGRES